MRMAARAPGRVAASSSANAPPFEKAGVHEVARKQGHCCLAARNKFVKPELLYFGDGRSSIHENSAVVEIWRMDPVTSLA